MFHRPVSLLLLSVAVFGMFAVFGTVVGAQEVPPRGDPCVQLRQELQNTEQQLITATAEHDAAEKALAEAEKKLKDLRDERRRLLDKLDDLRHQLKRAPRGFWKKGFVEAIIRQIDEILPRLAQLQIDIPLAEEQEKAAREAYERISRSYRALHRAYMLLADKLWKCENPPIPSNLPGEEETGRSVEVDVDIPGPCENVTLVWYLVKKETKDVFSPTSRPPSIFGTEPFNTTTEPTKPRRKVIEINHKKSIYGFHPSFAVVSLGTEIEFKNTDDIIHGAFSWTPGNSFGTGLFRGSSFYTPVSTGIIKVHSPIHEAENMTILVIPSDYWVIHEPGKDPKFDNVPPGEYEMRCSCSRPACCPKDPKPVVVE